MLYVTDGSPDRLKNTLRESLEGRMLSRTELYEFHANECIRAAERTNDPTLRERYLRLAREWRLDLANLGAVEALARLPQP